MNGDWVLIRSLVCMVYHLGECTRLPVTYRTRKKRYHAAYDDYMQ